MQKRKSPPKGAYAGRRGINSKSTATAAQHARIKELRQMGHQIKTGRISLWDSDGFEHRGVALYSLQGGDHE